MPINPLKYIRKKYLELFESAYLTAYDGRVPPDLVPIPNPYIIIGSQTKVEINRTKCDLQHDVTTVIDIYYRQQRGVNDRSVVDNLEQVISDLIHPSVKTDIEFDGFKTYNTFTEQPIDIPQETATETVYHRALRFRHIVGELDTVEDMVIYFGATDADPYADILAGTPPALAFFSTELINATSYYLNFTAAANGNYPVFAELIGAPQKTAWFSTAINNGNFPDQVWRAPVEVDGYRWYVGRNDNFYLQENFETLLIS